MMFKKLIYIVRNYMWTHFVFPDLYCTHLYNVGGRQWSKIGWVLPGLNRGTTRDSFFNTNGNDCWPYLKFLLPLLTLLDLPGYLCLSLALVVHFLEIKQLYIQKSDLLCRHSWMILSTAWFVADGSQSLDWAKRICSVPREFDLVSLWSLNPWKKK